MKIYERLTELRKEKGLSQLELAEMMNVSRQAVSRWEVGDASPSIQNLISLSKLYGVSLDDLVKESDEGTKQEKAQEEQSTKTKAERTKRALFKKCLIIGLIVLDLFAVIYCVYRVNSNEQGTAISGLQVDDDFHADGTFSLGWGSSN